MNHELRNQQLRRAFVVAEYALPFVLMAMTLSAGAERKKELPEVSRKIPFGMQTVRFDGVCAVLGGSMSADEFFATLQLRKSSKGTEFWKNGQIVKDFPPMLSIEIVAVPRMCNRQVSDDLEPRARTIMDQLQFDVEWKTGTAMTPASNIVMQKSWHGLEPLVLVGPGAVADVWKYKMTISASNVPLETHLIVSVFTGPHTRIARLSARLYE